MLRSHSRLLALGSRSLAHVACMAIHGSLSLGPCKLALASAHSSRSHSALSLSHMSDVTSAWQLALSLSLSLVSLKTLVPMLHAWQLALALY